MEKVDYKHGKITILSNEINLEDFERSEYEGWCEDNGITPGNDDDFFGWCADCVQNYYEADMDNIESCAEYNVPVVVTGTLGLWWGRPEIRPERFESVADAIHRCINGSNCVEIHAEYDDGVITVDCYHHDGCNCFTIKALSKKGIAKQYAEYKDHDFKRLPYLYAI
jgi:hypothetical protein